MSALAILSHPSSPKDSTSAGPVEGLRRVVPISVSGGLFHIGDQIYSNNPSLIRAIEKTYQFEQGAFDRIFRTLGKGDVQAGAARFELLAQMGAITIERVGFRKPHNGGGEKYYLMVNQTRGMGGINQFHKGFSRRGTERAITRPQPLAKQVHSGAFHALLQKGLQHALLLSTRYNELAQGGFGRVLSAEEGLKASELGGENLAQVFDGKGASRSERCKIYESVLFGLDWIQSHGLVHRDLKLENVVVIRRQDVKEGRIKLDNVPDLEEGDPKEIVGAKIIDHDFLVERGAVSTIRCGTHLYYSPELCIKEFVSNKASTADFANDEWAFMYMICEIESTICASNPDDCLLSEAAIDRFEQYQKNVQEADRDGNINCKGYYSRLKAMMIQNGADLKKETQNLFVGIEPTNNIENYVFSKAFFSLPNTLPRPNTSLQHKKPGTAIKITQYGKQTIEKRVVPKEQPLAPVQAHVIAPQEQASKPPVSEQPPTPVQANDAIVPQELAIEPPVNELPPVPQEQSKSFFSVMNVNRVAVIALLGLATLCAVKAVELSASGSNES